MNPRYIIALLFALFSFYGRAEKIPQKTDSGWNKYNAEPPVPTGVKQEPPPPTGEAEPEDSEDEGDSLLEIIVGAIALIALWTSLYQNWLTRDSDRRSLRAYVGIKTDLTEKPPAGVVARFKIMNFGQTPALDVRVTKNVHITQTPKREQLFENWKATAPSVINPGDFVALDIEHPINAETLDNIHVHGTQVLIIHGFIFYRDIYGDKWGAHYQFIGSKGTKGHLGPDSEGNFTDETPNGWWAQFRGRHPDWFEPSEQEKRVRENMAKYPDAPKEKPTPEA